MLSGAGAERNITEVKKGNFQRILLNHPEPQFGF
jgi:hypothetical protein